MKLELNLSGLVGNRRLIEILRQGSMPQSAVFAGPDGVGKKTAALLLATLANCHSPRDRDLCGSCPACIKALSGNHPDISLVEPDGAYLKIEQMRTLSREAMYRPFEGNFKFFILDKAEKMTPEAANSLLKILEEPPSTTHLALITSAPEQLLPTIRSRCQIFHFHPLSCNEIADYLRRNHFEGDLELRAGLSRGSLGTAIGLDLDQLLADREQMWRILKEWLQVKKFTRIFQACEDRDLKGLLKQRETVRKYLEQLENLVYDLYFILTEMPDRTINRDIRDDLIGVAADTGLDQVRDLLESLAEAKRDLSANVNPLICFETLWLDAGKIG